MDESKKTESKNGPEEGPSKTVAKVPASKGKGEPDGTPPVKDSGTEAAKVQAEKPPKEVPTAGAPVKKAAGPLKKPAGEKVPPPPRKPKGPEYDDLEDDPLLAALQRTLGDDKVSGQSFIGQKIYTVDLDGLFDAMLFLRDQPAWDFDYLVDLTALDYLEDEKRFCMVYQLYSYRHLALIRVKSRLAKDETAPSVAAIWKTANWMEREVYDMFGIEFSGHPDLKRILLPEDWQGFPLRKDYDIKLQDQAWIRKHLRIRKVPN